MRTTTKDERLFTEWETWITSNLLLIERKIKTIMGFCQSYGQKQIQLKPAVGHYEEMGTTSTDGG